MNALEIQALVDLLNMNREYPQPKWFADDTEVSKAAKDKGIRKRVQLWLVDDYGVALGVTDGLIGSD